MCYDCRNKSDDEDLLREIEELIKNDESICFNQSIQQSKVSQSEDVEISLLSTIDTNINPSFDNLNKDFYYWALRYLTDKIESRSELKNIIEDIRNANNIETGFEL